MGSHVQKILPGRGDQKGPGVGLSGLTAILPFLPPLLLVFPWFGFLADFPLSRPEVWFPLGIVVTAVSAVPFFIGKRKGMAVEFSLSLLLLLAGMVSFSQLSWMRLAYFPAVILIASLYPYRIAMHFSFFLPLIGLKTLLGKLVPFYLPGSPFSMATVIEEIALSFFLIVTVVLVAIFQKRLKKGREKAETSLDEIRKRAKGITVDAGMETLSNDEIISHYFASILRTDEEIHGLLLTVKNAVFADAAHLFVPVDESFVARGSTEEKDVVTVNGGGAILRCMREKKVFSSGEVQEKGIDIGFQKKVKIASLIAIPITEGSAITGVLAVDSARYQAFSETEKNTVRMFADHLVRILERQRIYTMIKREVVGLKILKEESGQLVSSLNIDILSKRICEVAEKIAMSQTFFFILHGRQFELKYYTGEMPTPQRVFDFRGTILNLVIENRHKHYVRDLREYRIEVMPFRTPEVRSVMALPMLYENSLLGLLVMLSEERDFLDVSQISLLEVLCNQASTSIANARLHAEIERMATTDGLTSLYNHRVFQEKLSAELKRLSRFSGPMSLLLTDIDFFKKVNDTYGHPVGDIVLKGVARIVRETIRDIDIPARYGGEEFAVILPGTDGEGAKNIAERLRKAVMDEAFTADGRTLKVTLSIGISVSPMDAKTKEDLIDKADQSLYHAKHNGRNQSVLWSTIR